MTDSRLAEALFSPKTIALIGASGDAKKNTSRPQRYLHKHGYPGRVVPINPGRSEILGDRAYPDLASVPGSIDHAFIMVPADLVNDAVEQCAAKNVPLATIYSDGFAETGEAGRRRQMELMRIARSGGVRLLGPNCIGLYNSRPPCPLSVLAVLEELDVKPGPISIVSQSGSVLGGLLSRGHGRGVGFSKLVSVGNECDLGAGEIADLLVDDEHTGAIVLFLETIRDADRLAQAARRAFAVNKPVIVYMLGRSKAGQQVAASHTGAIAGADAVADAFFRAHGVVRVDTLENLFELPALLSGQKPARRHRVATVTTTGGGAAIVVDRIGAMEIEVVPPSRQIIENLASRNIRISDALVTDLTLGGAKKEIYGGVLNELLASDHCDLVLAVAGGSAQTQPHIAIEPLLEADRRGKPLAVFLAPHAEASLRLLAAAGIAGFRTPEACADALRAWRDWKEPASAPRSDVAALQLADAKLAAISGGKINEYEACSVFAALGVAHPAAEVIATPGQKTTISFPVAAKILSRDIQHKTDAQGVVLNIATDAELAAAASRMLDAVRRSHAGARVDGVLVQKMERGLAEVIVGYKRDPQYGPVIMLGIGGTLAEIYKDFALRMAPIDVQTARDMIEEVRGLAVIRGYRGLPRGDCEALAHAVAAMSQLALIEHRVKEAEINPLIVKGEGEGVVAVDGLIVLQEGD